MVNREVHEDWILRERVDKALKQLMKGKEKGKEDQHTVFSAISYHIQNSIACIECALDIFAQWIGITHELAYEILNTENIKDTIPSFGVDEVKQLGPNPMKESN